MSEKVYNLFLLKRPTERWLRLAPAEQNALLKQINEGLAAAGGRRVVGCNAYWCNEGYRGFGVEEFPDFAAWRGFADLREKLAWYSYLDTWSILGTWHEAVDPAEVVAPEPGRIYQLFLLRHHAEGYEQLPQAEKDALWAQVGEAMPDAKWIVAANCYWASEEYQAFGVQMRADLDAVQRSHARQLQFNWPRYVRARIMLGTLWEA
ncbi:MAG: hypothetical protein MUC51_01235 [Anaerolineae bacterium]|nr:hypothetical protein [Anaerolineae bacterium]